MKKSKLIALISLVLIIVVSLSMTAYAYVPMTIATDNHEYYWKWMWEGDGSYRFDSQSITYKTVPYNPNATCYLKYKRIITWSDGFMKTWKCIDYHWTWYDRVTGYIISP